MKVSRVMFLTSRQTSCLQFMCRDLAHGFRRLGCDVEIIIERTPKSSRTDWGDVDAITRWFKPHIVFQMDHLRAESEEMWGKGPAYVSWIQDALPHLFQEPNEMEKAAGITTGAKLASAVGQQDFILTSFPGLRARMVEAGYPPERIWHLPVGANFDMFHPAPIPKDAAFTIGFPCNVGHPATARDPVRYRRRTEPVRWLIEAGIRVKLWGDGWDENPTFAPHWLGKVANGPELREAYNSCHAVLHANSDTNLHQRVFEAAACGRPVLTYSLDNDLHPDGIMSHGLPGVLRFSNKAELWIAIDTARQIVQHDSWWQMREGIRMREDYVARCSRIIEIVEGAGGTT